MILRAAAVGLLVMGSLMGGLLAQAATISGTVTDKTTGKPAAGDAVVLVDPQAGMSETAHATTDARGHYSLNKSGSGPALVRVTHQGAPYFIAAPEGGAQGDIPVYDVTAKVAGVFCEADVMELDGANGQLRVTERYFVHNTSTPPTTQWSTHSFEIVLPQEAVVESVAGQRPGGLPTSLKLDPDGPKGHYAFNFPIQPDDGDKSTLFEIEYVLPYSSGKFTFKPLMTLPTQSVGVLVPKSMSFTAGAGSAFQSVQADPGIQTFVARNALPGKALEFTVSGTGSITRDQQNAQGGQGAADSQPGTQPGGGIGTPINTPDPLSKYKWWIFGGLALLMVVAAAFLLRKPAAGESYEAANALEVASPATKSASLLNALKEELFAVESEKITGTISAEEYAQVKAALETVLKRALKRQGTRD